MSIIALAKSALHSLSRGRAAAKDRLDSTKAFNNLAKQSHGAERHGAQTGVKSTPFMPGDIFFKHIFAGDPIGVAIQLGQNATGQGSAHYVHAGLMGTTQGLVEMGGSGILMNSVAFNEDYTYDVYRCN
jgi:hypothetical protein